jgi:hypothetical protein
MTTIRHPHKGPYLASPPTTDYALVFNYDKSNYRFDRGFYSPALTDGRVSYDQMQLFLNELDRIVRRKLRPIATLTAVFAILVFCGFFGLLLSCFGFFDDSDYNFDDNTTNTNTNTDTDFDYDFDDQVDSFFASMILYFLFVIIGAALLQAYSLRRHRKVRKCAQSLIDRNAATFAPLGLRWNLPMHFPYWIELWKDYKGQISYPQVTAQPYLNNNTNNTYMTPNQETVLQVRHILPNLPNAGLYPTLPRFPTYQSNLGYQPIYPNQIKQREKEEENTYVPPSINN